MNLLRENKDTLLGVLEPFIRDPTVSWGRSGRAQRTENANKISTGAIQDNDNTDAKEALLKITERLNGIYNLCHPSGESVTFFSVPFLFLPLPLLQILLLLCRLYLLLYLLLSLFLPIQVISFFNPITVDNSHPPQKVRTVENFQSSLFFTLTHSSTQKFRK